MLVFLGMAEIAEYVMVDSSNYTLRQYSYDNHAFPEWTSGIIWRATSCDGLPAPVDLISFQSGSEVTDWHGSFQEAGGRIILKFNCKGLGHRLKTAVLFVTDRDRSIYEGVDYQRRNITLTLQRVADFNRTRHAWTWR